MDTGPERTCETPGCGYRGPGEPSKTVETLGCIAGVLLLLGTLAGVSGPGGMQADPRRCPKCGKWMKPAD